MSSSSERRQPQSASVDPRPDPHRCDTHRVTTTFVSFRPDPASSSTTTTTPSNRATTTTTSSTRNQQPPEIKPPLPPSNSTNQHAHRSRRTKATTNLPAVDPIIRRRRTFRRHPPLKPQPESKASTSVEPEDVERLIPDFLMVLEFHRRIPRKGLQKAGTESGTPADPTPTTALPDDYPDNYLGQVPLRGLRLMSGRWAGVPPQQ